MSLTNAWTVLRKDLQMGPRSPLLLWAVLLPVVITVVVRGIFGSLFAPEPRLGIVDEGGSAVAEAAHDLDGIRVVDVSSEDRLRAMVRGNDLDAGLVLPRGFDAAVRAGEQPPLQLVVGGESLASNRIVLAVTTLDLVRSVAGGPSPVDVRIIALGEASLDVTTRMLPILVTIAVAIAGAMVPAASLVEEKERQTLQAVLVTPLSMSEVLLAKGVLGVVLAIVTGLMTLALNGGFGQAPVALLAGIVVGAVMMAEIGLMLGAWAKDTNTLFTAWKGGGILLFYPAIFALVPSLPDWLARIGPTYYFLHPIYRVAVEGAGLGEVWTELVIGAGICVALAPLVPLVGRWLERRLGGGQPGSRRRRASVAASA